MVQRRRTTAIRKDQIVTAAKRLIIKRGSENITVRAIAKEVGLSEGAVYRHFNSKRDILSLLADIIEDDLLGDITTSIANSDSCLEILDNILKGHLSAIKQRQGISFQVIAEIISLGDKKLNRRISEIIDKYVVGIKGLLSKGIKSGELRKDLDLHGAALLFFGMVQGLVNIWALSNYEFDLEESCEPSWNTFKECIKEKPF
ncbi:MAG: TetR/AcrR family transcriptional regulator [Dehalococcoidales bacterium]|nr:TetR/AcrR family transcriptional regulator [Dehalococcoidales bacterium]